MAIAYRYEPTGEVVEREVWTWKAIHKDGSTLEQFEVSPRGAFFHRFAEIDKSKLIAMQLCHDTFGTISVDIDEYSEPIHFYRNRHIVEEFIDNAGNKLTRTFDVRIYVVGFRVSNVYWLVYVDKNGKQIFSRNDKLFIEE